ncbi:hypothetical protein AVEN_111544-1 [Araneus ventricosus]|uniref:Uncharacterized protein n=1 Tax=Araneus ventricosus TaxID=182803 RepID=A0A4Y2PBI8_ARAVE|nr:hypothetical protein AVEN_111544-1 [Araneus ventricosus]
MWQRGLSRVNGPASAAWEVGERVIGSSVLHCSKLRGPSPNSPHAASKWDVDTCCLRHAQDRLLLNLVDLKIKLIRSEPEFCLVGSDDYKIVFDHASLFVRKARRNPGVLIARGKALEKSTAKYPIDRVVCKVFSIPQSSYSFVQDNVFSGQMPKRIVLACVDNDALNGNYKKSPFEFNHYNANFIGVYVDGQTMPHQHLEVNFEKNNYIRAYQNLFLNSEGLSIKN